MSENEDGDGAGDVPGPRWLRPVCYGLASLLLAGAGAYLIFGPDKGVGIFLVLVAAVVSRVLVLNVAERRGE